jgi:basic membrane lipoprotein Med (substrate-binding protein (PBP1-ABC) superfamily)
MTRRTWIVGIAGAVALVAVIATVVVISHQGDSQERVAYANISQNYRVCLARTASDQGVPVWQALQDAAKQAAINVEQVTVPAGPAAQQAPYLNGLVAQKCDLIVIAGQGLHNVVDTVAKDNPGRKFAVVNDKLDRPNVQAFPDPAALSGFVANTARH